MKFVVSPIALQAIRIPGIHALTRTALRFAYKRNKAALPCEIPDSVESFFVHDLIGNIDLDQDGKTDSFRLCLTNGWFNQKVTGIEIAVNGRKINPEKILIDNDYSKVKGNRIRNLRFEAGRPFSIILENKKLRGGLNFISLDLDCELAPVRIPLLPVVMKKDEGAIPLLGEPWDRSLEFTEEEPRAAEVHFTPHIHYDFEWLQNSETFSRVAVENLDEAVRILEANPEVTFVIDQVPQLEALAKSSPESYQALRRFAAQGRVEPVLGGYVEPDTNLPLGESLVRQFVNWQNYSMKVFGRYSTTAWLIDSFGMSAQLPQIIRKCGADALIFSRKLPDDAEVNSDFWWEGIDGTKMQTHHLSHFYFAAYPIDSDEKRARYRLSRAKMRLAGSSEQHHLFCPSGIDHGRPQESAVNALKAWAENPGETQIKFSTPERYLNSVDPELFRTFAGELGPSMTGVNAARIGQKQLGRKTEAARPYLS